MATLDWASLLDEANWTGARAAWQERFAAESESLAASWALAEVEERWGDCLFFAGEAGAAEHFHAAQRALAPPGKRFDSPEEGARRMEAFGRVMEKLYAIDPAGRARAEHGGKPHPNSHRTRQLPARVPESVEPASPFQQDRLEAVDRVSGARGKQRTEMGRLFDPANHWRCHTLGSQWRAAGEALAGSYPEGAQAAYEWSLHYFELYNKAWRANLPASRWDSDGGEEMQEVQGLLARVPANSSKTALPPWVAAVLAGEWQQALSALGDDNPLPPAFRPMTLLLAAACGAAGREDDARLVLARGGAGTAGGVANG